MENSLTDMLLAALPPPSLAAGAILAFVVALFGLVQGLVGLILLWRFLRAGRAAATEPPAPAKALPAITILKPLHGDEPRLEEALTSFFMQDYPQFQIVFGVQSANDPAIAVVEHLRARFPTTDTCLVIDATQHGTNRKVSNLINMMGKARHDLLVLADSDIHAAPDYLLKLAQSLALPGTGMATTLYTGLPATRGFIPRLGAAQINYAFLPGVLIGRAFGREDGLGATMATTRAVLDRIGGFPALANHIADDAMLAAKVRALGLAIRLAPTIPATTVAEHSLGDLCRRELRWARVNRSLAPVPYAASVIQYPLVFALIGLTLMPGSSLALAGFALAWIFRALIARGMDRALGLGAPAPALLLPLRDLLSAVAVVKSFTGHTVHWRGEVLAVDRPSPFPPKA